MTLAFQRGMSTTIEVDKGGDQPVATELREGEEVKFQDPPQHQANVASPTKNKLQHQNSVDESIGKGLGKGKSPESSED